MFDANTTQLLRSAPGVPGLNPQDIPALLTRHYANLVSARLRGSVDASGRDDEAWPLDRIADTYELIASLDPHRATRRASAFVAGTAQQIIARRQVSAFGDSVPPANIDRDRVDPTIAATVLFLTAEQYADAHESASQIRTNRSDLYEGTILAEDIADLGRGRLNRILDRAGRWRSGRRPQGDLDQQAVVALLETLITGIEILATQYLGLPIPEPSAGRFDTPREAFRRVLELSAAVDTDNIDELGSNILNAYAGPHHLASLLIAAHDGIAEAALIRLPPPDGADIQVWRRWLGLMASRFPFLWPNHREAIAKGFHNTGKSAVVVLPTGAGKTTVSSLKIAGVLARRKKIVFLAPTHALVEQLTIDLQELFPKEIIGSVVSSDFDLLFQSGVKLQEIEVMTPERCLAMLSFAPEAFDEVGLLVFDECHLLSPRPGKIRRALDGMLCLLAFTHIAPDADLLFLSAMLKNSEEFGEWISDLTGRPCVCVDLLWKPSRQARGVLIYDDADLQKAKAQAASIQNAENRKKGKTAKGLRAAAQRELVVHPWAIWGLQHNWLGDKDPHCIRSKVLDERVTLAGDIRYGSIHLTPNANQVAIHLAVSASKNALKSIVFVNTKDDAVGVAKQISLHLNEAIQPTKAEEERWKALEAELGDLKHALLPKPAIAVPHNSSMLRLERELAERMFRRVDGAKVIVATPTLAQGLNLPAHLAILAGDKRTDANRKGREDLEAHEILNAAARAGRAGHLANGIVLLIPEPIISFSDGAALDMNVIQKLNSVLPEDDRCVVITDPLEIVLDRLMQGQTIDEDVRYTVHRMATLPENDVTGTSTFTSLFDLRKSFCAFAARKQHIELEFEEKVAGLKKLIAHDNPDSVDSKMAALASQSGLSTDLLLRLRKKIAEGAGSLPTTVEDWVIWTISWLTQDPDACTSLLYDVKNAVLGACGAKKDGEITPNELEAILPGLLGWIRGKPLAEIEKELGGEPNAKSDTKRACPRARELVSSVIPRGFSFVMGLVSHVVGEVDPFSTQENLRLGVVECLGTAVRKGYDSPEKVSFAGNNPTVLSRVQMHQLWFQSAPLI